MNILKINNFNTFYNYSIMKSPSYTKRLSFGGRDTVSFTAKKVRDENQAICNLPEDAFPSAQYRKFVLDSISNPQNEYNIVELHKKYYGGLLDCKTLKEAKELYPEFEDVVDGADIDISKTSTNSIFRKIQNGEIEGINLDNVSLAVLKMFFGDLAKVKQISGIFGLGGSGYSSFMKTLNIKMDHRYINLIKSCRTSCRFLRLWEDPQHRQYMSQIASEHAKKQWEDPNYRKLKVQQGKDYWTPELRASMSVVMAERRAAQSEDPEYKRRISEIFTNYWSDPVKRQEQSERIKKVWSENTEFVKKMEIVYRSRTEAFKRHPEISKIYKDTADEFPASLKIILAKKRNGDALTEQEKVIMNGYYKRCIELCPNAMKIIGETQKQVLREWGFYDKDTSSIVDGLAQDDLQE